MKLIYALSTLALAASAAHAQDLKQANPPLRATGSLTVKIKVALPEPIVFVRTGDQKGIWKRDIDGRETRLTSGDDSAPASYSGGRIYFGRRTGSSSNVWSMKRDGTDERLELSDGYAPQPHASVLAFLRRESGELGKVLLMVRVGADVRKVASAGWMPRGYYITRPVFEPGTSRILAGIYEKDDGASKPKVKVRAFNFDGTYNELWSGVADSVSGMAVYKEGATVRRLGILAPRGPECRSLETRRWLRLRAAGGQFRRRVVS